MKHLLFLAFLSSLSLLSCTSDPYADVTWQNMEKDLQTKFILVENGNTVEIPEGHFIFEGTLSLESKENVTITGQGMDKTFLSFEGQTAGAEGIRVDNGSNITLENMTLLDSKGDLIKTRRVDGLTFRNLKVEWTGEPNEDNGAYGLYPVDCDNVMIDNCTAIGASDAGIYVGQSRNVVVKNCTAKYNVAGIEIENTLYAEVYDNYATNNTGGLLIFDMPGLSQSGGYVRAYNNLVEGNNYRNFAPEGNIVGTVPPGTGMMIMGTSNVELFDNQVLNNKTQSMGIVSFYMSGFPVKDSTYNPYPQSIYIHNNTFKRRFGLPSFKSDIGKLLASKFWFSTPHILYDGIINPEALKEDGTMKAEYSICLKDNEGQTFANVDAGNDFKNVNENITPYLCERKPIASK